MKTQTIGELSRNTGVHIETIRYYEREGILPTPMRSAAGRRIYSDEDVRRLNFIHKCRGLGFSLKEINSLLSLVDSGEFSCKEVHELTIHHAGQITEKIFNLKKMEGVLQEMAAQCNQGNVPKCPIIDSLFDA
ncbi:MAG TPA: MerR family transcriptional regulator [Gammaproteobacteria bacterium]|nr:MerR family transcriptional regulator [Gammaproteobacteria bacterium]HIL62569.1 MerR family transcriptional regulator [Porticoccaceae bacterium]